MEARLLERGAQCENTCLVTNTGIIQEVEDVLWDVHYARVAWIVVDPKPNFVLSYEDKELECAFHDILLIETPSGEQFVVDPTGAQFGFTNWFWRAEDYFSLNTTGTAPLWTEAKAKEVSTFLE